MAAVSVNGEKTVSHIQSQSQYAVAAVVLLVHRLIKAATVTPAPPPPTHTRMRFSCVALRSVTMRQCIYVDAS